MHTAWGRTLKDVFQRYKALRGFDQRYQNGFDCQGLWIEVGVERAARAQLEARDRGVRARGVRRALPRGRRLVGRRADQGLDAARHVDGLGQRLLHVQRHEHRVHLAVPRRSSTSGTGSTSGHRATEWCPRCGTSISAHELAGSYVDRADPSLYVRLPLLDRPGESLVVWTTTPWTLPANVAAAVKPDADYGRRLNGEWVAAPRYPDESLRRGAARLRARRLALRGPVRRPARPARRSSTASSRGTRCDGRGHRHRPHRARLRRRGLRARRRSTTCPCSRPSTSRAASTTTTAGCTASPRSRRPSRSSATSRRRGRLVEAGLYEHRYPECWRCHTPLIFRIADDWFISVARPPRSRCATRTRRSSGCPTTWASAWTTGSRNMGDWNISRRRYYGLPLPFYPCACGHLNVIGSQRGARGAGGRAGSTSSRSCAARGSTACRSAASSAASAVERIVEVGDVWLDAGIVPFSTLGWQNDDVGRRAATATGAARGLTERRPARPRLLGAVVPRRLGHRRCASRSGSGSTRSSSCRSCSRAARRSSACSATRRCSTRTAGRCTARGGT